ncbi:MAG: hypothetical protein Tp170SUR191951_59 [Prokaryotic dsDNA virus sp.]|nr:hypothetical protein [Pseudomonas sp.]MBS67356.1 hypothetical protein [Pseudomonas sp.]QDP55221.1 MAG: hypothetical protein Tp170SUR191951_59 [Prokaryotic dsDNA virus sp.]|tara:strand:- start:2669 stop:4117 length:1449 start_codon:yes stop_codon:yes gene_type:complete
MRIVQFHAENFKRLGLVEITPEGNLVTIGGKNGQGKSSVLDAIFVALKGRAVAPPKPIRAGEERCVIQLDLGDLVVTRTFRQQEGKPYTDAIKIEDSEGRRYGKPQEVLNGLLGEIGFDPFEFVNLKPKEQVARLLEMVPLSIDLDDYAAADTSDFENRRDVNRDVARLKAQLEGIPKKDVPGDLPDREALREQLGNAANTNAAITREQQRREDEGAAIGQEEQRIKNERARIAEQRRLLDEAEQAANEASTKLDDREKALAALPPLDEYVDTDAIRQKLAEADAIQATVDEQNRRAQIAKELDAAEAKSQEYTDAMATRAKERNAALAEAEMPVEGLAFSIDEKGEATLTYEGLPFDKDQISTAAMLRVSTAVGMASNPRLRVLRIMDGSLLDEDSMKLLAEMAEAEDFQLWVEVVGDGGVGIVMENGTIRGAPDAEGDAKEKAAAEIEAKIATAKAEEKPKAKASKGDAAKDDLFGGEEK